jgi:hypothetical protein
MHLGQTAKHFPHPTPGTPLPNQTYEMGGHLEIKIPEGKDEIRRNTSKFT